MYKTDKKTKEIIDIRWCKNLGDDNFHLEKLVRTSEYIFNDDPNCPEYLRLTAIPNDEWENVLYILADCYCS